ncbi:MAG TPA: SRPBCC family protein [Rubrobacteraceae bacterium]|nr:SRPBCC family protein [Rubrobacteraceae bacterium]
MAQRIDGSIEIEAPVAKVYDYWKTLENLPKFMSNIEEVRPTGPDTTHWIVRGPLGYKAEFDAKTTQNEPNQAIAWNTENGDVETSGQVRFQELTPNRTRVEVQMNYWNPPGGKVGEAASRVTSGPKTILVQDLQNFKDIMEGTATPEEVQQRPSAADVHSGAITFLTSGTGLLVVGGSLVLWLLLRRRGGSSSRKKSRIIFEF